MTPRVQLDNSRIVAKNDVGWNVVLSFFLPFCAMQMLFPRCLSDAVGSSGFGASSFSASVLALRSPPAQAAFA